MPRYRASRRSVRPNLCPPASNIRPHTMHRRQPFAAALSLMLATSFAWAGGMTGTWRHHYRGSEGTTFTEVTLRQNGRAISGLTVEDGSGPGVRRWENCVRGGTDGHRATVRSCSINQGGLGAAVVACPSFGPPQDQFVLVDGKLLWFRRNGPSGKWGHYKTMRPVKRQRASTSDECLWCGLSPRSSRLATAAVAWRRLLLRAA